MSGQKLIRAIQALNRKEMTRFREFAASPYFNKHQDVRALVDYFHQIYPSLDGNAVEKSTLFQQVFPKLRKYQETKLAPILTYTQRLLEQFLAVEGLQEDTRQQELYRLAQWRQRQLHKDYERRLLSTTAELEQATRRDSHYYRQRYELAAEADDFYTQQERHEADANLTVKQSHLDYFFLAEKLKDACELYVRRHILSMDYRPRLLEIALQEVGQNLTHYQQEPPVILYYLVYKMLTNATDADYQQVLEALRQHEHAFSRQELIQLYNYLMNFCIARINRGEGNYLGEIFDLYGFQLEQGLLLEDGYLSEWDYKNMVTTGLRLQRLDWVYQFIEQYRTKLHPDVEDNAYRFNLASYYYAAGDYGKVLDLLIRVEYSDLRYNLGARALLLRTYYDLGEWDPLFSLTESFRQYLIRNKLLSDVRRMGYYNLFKLTRRAAQLRSRIDYDEPEKMQRSVAKLEREFAHAGSVFNRSWLEEKIAELRGMV